MEVDVTSYTTKGIPDGLWDHWKDPIPRHVEVVGDRNIQLLALDVACRDQHNVGIIEYALQNDIVDEDDIDAALDKDPIEK